MKKMKESTRKRVIYGSIIGVLLLLFIVMNVRSKQVSSVDVDTFISEKSTSVIKKKPSATEEEPVIKDKRSAQDVAIHFTQNLFSFTDEGQQELLKDRVDDLEKAIELESKGKKKQEVTDVEIVSYDPVQDTKHVVLSFFSNNEKQAVFLVLQELEGGFKVIEFQSNTQPHSDIE